MLCKRFTASEKYFKNVSYLISSNQKINKFGTTPTSGNSFKPVFKYNFFKTNIQPYKNFTSKTTVNQSEMKFNSSIDPDEIKKFKSLAESWWVENGEFEALHRMNLLRVPLIRDTLVSYRNSLPLNEKNKTLTKSETAFYSNEELLREPLLGLNILDVGCGGGILSEALARLGATVTAIDACKENIACAQIRVQSEMEKSNKNLKFYDRLNYLNCLIEDLAAIDDNSCFFDGIVMSEVVEHVANLQDFIMNSTKLLKQNGYSFVTTINRTPQSYLLAIVGAEYILNLVPKGTHNWNKFVTPNELKDILEKNEVFVKFEMGMSYNPLTKTWCWSKDNSVNYALYAQKIHLKHHT